MLGIEELPEAQLQLSDEEKRDAEGLADQGRAGAAPSSAGAKARSADEAVLPAGRARQDPSHRYAIVFCAPNESERRYVVVDLTR